MYRQPWKHLHRRFSHTTISDNTQRVLGLTDDIVIKLPIKKVGDWKRITPVAVLRNDKLAMKFLFNNKEFNNKEFNNKEEE